MRTLAPFDDGWQIYAHFLYQPDSRGEERIAFYGYADHWTDPQVVAQKVAGWLEEQRLEIVRLREELRTLQERVD
jgi:hypothetical protein